MEHLELAQVVAHDHEEVEHAGEFRRIALRAPHFAAQKALHKSVHGLHDAAARIFCELLQLLRLLDFDEIQQLVATAAGVHAP